MIRGSYGIVFDLKGDHSIENIKRRLHSVLNKMFGDYYNKNWIDNRIYLEVTTRNVFIENEDLARSLFSEGIVALEMNICQEFQPLTIFAFYLDDSTGGRGLSLLDTNTIRDSGLIANLKVLKIPVPKSSKRILYVNYLKVPQ